MCFKGSQVDFPNKYVLQSLKITFIIANNADPDEMQILGVSSIQRVYSPLSDEFNQVMPQGPKVARPMGQMFRLIIGMSHVLLIEVLHPVLSTKPM